MVLCLAALCLLALPARARAEEAPNLVWDVMGEVGEEPIVEAAAAALLDAKSGRLLWQVNGFEPLPPASTTKILTALLALNMAEPDTQTVISAAAEAVGEATIYLRAGERLSLGDLLYGTLLRSGNDAAYAVSETVAGSEPLFVRWMNLKAHSLGAYSTDFKNTNGLPAQGHQISAADLALITGQALADDFFAKAVAQKSVNIGSGASRRHLQNINKLLWHDNNITGVKTGTTNAAGPCLVASMSSNNTELVSVVFNSSDRYGDSLRLLRFGAANFITTPLLPAGQLTAYIPVQQGEQEGVLLVAEGEVWCSYSYAEADGLFLQWHLPAQLTAPVTAGQHVGSLRVCDAAGQELANISLVAAQAVAAVAPPWWQKMLDFLKGGS